MITDGLASGDCFGWHQDDFPSTVPRNEYKYVSIWINCSAGVSSTLRSKWDERVSSLSDHVSLLVPSMARMSSSRKHGGHFFFFDKELIISTHGSYRKIQQKEENYKKTLVDPVFVNGEQDVPMARCRCNFLQPWNGSIPQRTGSRRSSNSAEPPPCSVHSDAMGRITSTSNNCTSPDLPTTQIRRGLTVLDESEDHRARRRRAQDGGAPRNHTAEGEERRHQNTDPQHRHLLHAAGRNPRRPYAIYKPRSGASPPSRRRSTDGERGTPQIPGEQGGRPGGSKKSPSFHCRRRRGTAKVR